MYVLVCEHGGGKNDWLSIVCVLFVREYAKNWRVFVWMSKIVWIYGLLLYYYWIVPANPDKRPHSQISAKNTVKKDAYFKKREEEIAQRKIEAEGSVTAIIYAYI